MYSVFVHTKEQYEVVKNYPVSMIYTDNERLLKEDENIYYQVPRYPHTKKLPQNILIQDLGCLLECQNKNIVTDTNLNVANSLAIEKLLSFGVLKVTLSLECSLNELKFLNKASEYPLEVVLYHRPLVMILKSHPLIKENGYELEDYEKKKYPILVDQEKHVHIYQYEVVNKLSLQKEYEALGVHHFRLQFIFETKEEVKKIMAKIYQMA